MHIGYDKLVFRYRATFGLMLNTSSRYAFRLETWKSQDSPDKSPIMAWVLQLDDAYVPVKASDDDDVITGSNVPCSARKVCRIGPASASRERRRILRTRNAHH